MNIKYSKRIREGKVSLWVTREGHPPYNIWDMHPKEATPAVLKAIQSAFDRGVTFAHQAMQEATPNTTHSVGANWEES